MGRQRINGDELQHYGFGLSHLGGVLLPHEAHICCLVAMQYRGVMFRSMIDPPELTAMLQRNAVPVAKDRRFVVDSCSTRIN